MLKKRCIIIGSSPDTDLDVIRKYIKDGDFIACADGGHLYAKKLGLKPSLIVGDFDSSSKPDIPGAKIIVLPTKKDDTDTVSIVKECLEIGFEEFLLFGMTGGRFDHTFANLSVLYSLTEKGKAAYIIDRKSIIQVIGKGTTVIEGKKDFGFGIFPFACQHIVLSLHGFEYELEDGVLYSDHPVGVSNTVTSDKAVIEIKNGTALTISYQL